jgi:hypothetical protein
LHVFFCVLAAKTYFDKVMAVPLHLIAYFHYFIWNFSVDWNPRSEIPVTACTADQKIKTMSSATRFILTMLQTCDRVEWRDMLSKCDIVTMHSRYVEWCDKASINNFNRQDLQMFAQTLIKYLLYTRVRQEGGGGSTTRLTGLLTRQRLFFASAMGLDRFPLLGEEQVPDEPAEPGLPVCEDDPVETMMDIYMDNYLSQDNEADDFKERIARSAKKQRRAIRDAACPDTCKGWHPAFVRLHANGELQGCLEGVDGATPFHSTLPGSAAVELAPLFVTADASI